MKKIICILTIAFLLFASPPTYSQSRAFQYDLRGDGGLYSHSLSNPTTDWTFIGGDGPEAEWDVLAMDADSMGTLYGVDLNVPLTLGTINPTSAVFSTVAQLSGDLPPTVLAMTIDSSNDVAWISDGNGLWTMDLATGVCSLVSNSFTNTLNGSAVTAVVELATDGMGNFFAFDVAQDTLWGLDESTGDLTSLGVFAGPGNAEFANNGLDFDPETGLLFADIHTGGGTGQYGTWDTNTGVFTTILDHLAFPLDDPFFGGPIACFGGTTYQVNFFLDSFLTYETSNPAAGATSIQQPTAASPAAMDFDETGSTLYAVAEENDTLGIIDPSTGNFTLTTPLVGDFQAPSVAVGMTCDGSTGQFYLSSTTSLYTLDVETGNTSLVGDYHGTVPSIVIEIACSDSGAMYIFSSGDDKLWSVNKATAEVTEVGTLPANAGSFLQGMDFDPASGELYASIDEGLGNGAFGIWDTTTGVFTTITRIEDLPSDGDGYQLKLAIKAPPQVVFPESLTVTAGTQNSGGLQALQDSDDEYLAIFRDSLSLTPLNEFELKATSPTASPAVLEFTLESSVFSRPAINQQIEFFDYVANEWEVVDVRAASRFVDLTVTARPVGDLSRFVEQTTNEVSVKISYRASSPRASFASNSDRAIWTIQ